MGGRFILRGSCLAMLLVSSRRIKVIRQMRPLGFEGGLEEGGVFYRGPLKDFVKKLLIHTERGVGVHSVFLVFLIYIFFSKASYMYCISPSLFSVRSQHFQPSDIAM